MWRRLNREDFTQSNLLLGDHKLHRPFLWGVYESYESLPSTEDVDSLYVQASVRTPGKKPKPIEVYEPLTDTPYLFLNFARIVESKDPDSALDSFFSKYGLLGLTSRNPQYSEPLPPHYDELIGRIVPDLYYDDRGGPNDRLDLIWDTVFQLNESLNCYEAALSRDEEKLERVLFTEVGEEDSQRRRQYVKERAEFSNRNWIDLLVDSALAQTMEFVVHEVRAFTYPDITFPHHELAQNMIKSPSLRVGDLHRSWGARNLLGAMSLQFYWLITSTGDLSRCKYCGRIINYSPPFPESAKRKPRKDKEFCGSQCRQNYHYHNRVKPRNKHSDS